MPSRAANGAIRASEPERDREALAEPRPGVAAVDRHPRKRPVRVQRDRDPERARIRRARVRELERDEREQRDGRGVPPHAPRPLEHRARLAPSQLEDPDGGVCDRAPRAEDAPDVPEEDREQRDPEPEDHEDEGRREVQELDRRPEERSRERQDEKAGRERPEARRERRAKARGRDSAVAAACSSVRMRLEQRPPPQIEEQDERDAEDDGRADEEVDRRDRQVADDADPVGDERHGWTVMSAICTPRSSSSTSKRPGIVALNGSRAGLPGATSRMMS